MEVAVEAARAGAAALRQAAGGDLDVRLKDARASLVTAADLRAQAAIVGVLSAAFPDHRIIGEEGSAGGADAEHAWLVDPLDGTTNFAHGLPFYGVSVALRRAGSTQVGVVLDPTHDELFTAERGAGARCNGQPLRVSAVDGLGQAVVATQAQTSDPDEIRAFSELMERLMNVARAVRFPGSPALVLCAVAAGRLGAFCERSLEAWDSAAGALIVEEAGGVVSRFDGQPHGGAGDLVASNGHLHDELLAVLAGLSSKPVRQETG